MRSNTDRSARTAFDAVADDYEAARPRFPAGQVARVLEWAGVEPGQRVLEIGAGTGQLTRALLEAGHPVLAVEPGRQMAERLRALDASGALRVEQAQLGEVDLRSEAFPVVVAANSFHWLDPAAEHPVVAQALEPGGRLVLLWTFLLSRDDAVAALAADPVVGRELGFLDARPDAEEHLERTARDGRAELDAGGLFGVDAWQFDRRTETRDAAGLVALVRSSANVAALPPQRRAALEQRVADVLVESGEPRTSIDVLTYAVVASRAAARASSGGTGVTAQQAPELAHRQGPRPRTSDAGPHRQLDQQAPPELWGRLVAEVFALPHVREGRSQVSPPASRAVLFDDLDEVVDPATSLAPLPPLEPVHLHGVTDTSLHLCLPSDRARAVCDRGWGEPHGYADHDTEVMVFGPRTEQELDVVLGLVRESLRFARDAQAVVPRR